MKLSLYDFMFLHVFTLYFVVSDFSTVSLPGVWETSGSGFSTGVFQQGCQDGYINSDVCSASPLEWHEAAAGEETQVP